MAKAINKRQRDSSSSEASIRRGKLRKRPRVRSDSEVIDDDLGKEEGSGKGSLSLESLHPLKRTRMRSTGRSHVRRYSRATDNDFVNEETSDTDADDESGVFDSDTESDDDSDPESIGDPNVDFNSDSSGASLQ
jgi:hypothetical protein